MADPSSPLVVAETPAALIFHCRIPHHTLDNNVKERGAGRIDSTDRRSALGEELIHG